MFAIFNDEAKQSLTAIISIRYYDSHLLSITLQPNYKSIAHSFP